MSKRKRRNRENEARKILDGLSELTELELSPFPDLKPFQRVLVDQLFKPSPSWDAFMKSVKIRG